MWTERYGINNYSHQDPAKAFPLQKQHHGWSWWQNEAKFTKLEDFWNRDMLRTRQASALNADASDNDRIPLGLSEFCNGNFISEDATYKECVTNPKHTFSYPSLDGTSYSDTRIKEVDNVLISSIHPVFLNNGHLARRIYLKKERDGIVVNNHCVLGYLGVALAARGPTPRLSAAAQIQRVSVSLDDTNVLQEYHEKLIPKAIEYSAGILDYFFRGTFAFGVSGDDSQSSITIKNTSSQDFYDGAFYVLIDADGVRTLVQSNHLDGLLPSGGSTSFTCNYAATNKYLCFYQGTIGWTNGAALDPVDAGNAVAIAVPPLITVTANPLWTDSGLTVSAGQTLTISASGTWSWASGEWTDADGTIISNPDVFLSGANQGSLTAYVGTHPPYEDDTGANRWGDASYFPRPPGNGYWLAGKRATITTDRTGELWFLFNDDATGQYIDDNAGTLEVRVTINN